MDEQTRCSKVHEFCVKHILPISLVVGVVVAILFPAPGVAVGATLPRGANCSDVGVTCRSPVAYTCITIIFFCSGLKLSTDEVKRALTEWKGALWGIVSILFLTVLVAVKLTQLITFPDGQDDLRIVRNTIDLY